MDLDLKSDVNNNDDDDEIIELTEIIEKGTNVKSTPDAIDDDLDTLMGDLGNAQSSPPNIPSQAESDIDALLAQMDADTPSSQGDSQPADSPINEPDTSDVDALLESLDMPPQPEESSNTSKDAMDEDNSADMDALLESILDDTAPEKESELTKTTSTPSNAAAIDDTMDEAIDEAAGERDILDDLDDLLKEVDNETESATAGHEEASENNEALDAFEIDKILDDAGLGESKVTAADIAESLLPPVKQAKTGNPVSDDIMEAIDAMTDTMNDLDKNVTPHSPEPVQQEPAPVQQEPAPAQQKPEPVKQEPAPAQPVAAPAQQTPKATIKIHSVAQAKSVNKHGQANAANERDQAELLAHIAQLEKRIIELEDRLSNDLESMAAKAAAKIIREEIAALLTDD